MEIKVKYFAVLRELLGIKEEWVTCADGATVEQLLAELASRHVPLQGKRSRLAIAVNQEYATGQTVLQDGDEVALLPPVAGGAPSVAAEPSEERPLFVVQETPLDPALVCSLVNGEFGGAIVTFTGIVRRHSQGKIVERLEYEAYGEMAVQELRKIGAEVAEKWPDVKVAIHHRVGALKVGDLAVVIAVCSPHRQAGFAACSYSIERLKETVPIWKKEFFTDGNTWVGWGP